MASLSGLALSLSKNILGGPYRPVKQNILQEQGIGCRG